VPQAGPITRIGSEVVAGAYHKGREDEALHFLRQFILRPSASSCASSFAGPSAIQNAFSTSHGGKKASCAWRTALWPDRVCVSVPTRWVPECPGAGDHGQDFRPHSYRWPPCCRRAPCTPRSSAPAPPRYPRGARGPWSQAGGIGASPRTAGPGQGGYTTRTRPCTRRGRQGHQGWVHGTRVEDHSERGPGPSTGVLQAGRACQRARAPGPYLACRSCQGLPEGFQGWAPPGAVEDDERRAIGRRHASLWLRSPRSNLCTSGASSDGLHKAREGRSRALGEASLRVSPKCSST